MTTNVELQAFMDEDDGQTQGMMAWQLNVHQKTTYLSLKTMDLILKDGRWVPQTDFKGARDLKITCKILLKSLKLCSKKLFLYRIIIMMMMKDRYILRIPKSYGPPGNKPNKLPSNIVSTVRQWCVFSGVCMV